MKAIIQRVMKASVTVGDETVGSIGRGLCVLVGISRYDTQKEMDYIVRKILNLKLFDDESSGKRWKKSVMDMDYEVLCVSQFTLEVTLKGNNVDFHCAMAPDTSQAFYETFLGALRAGYTPGRIQDGAFGKMMQVHIQNDGPITIPLEAIPVKPQDQAKSKDGSAKGDNSSEATS